MSELMNNQAKAQALYMDVVAKKAVEEAKRIQHPAFDPQGRLLVEVSLSDQEIQNLVQHINQELESDFEDTTEGLNEALGRVVTLKTTVSVDCAQDPFLYKQFENRLKAALEQIQTKNSAQLLAELKNQPRGSIIALQQEYHFHLSLVTRVYQKLQQFQSHKEPLEKARQNTLKQVNDLVIKAYAQALKESMKVDGTISQSQLNKKLDKARKEILPQAHTLLMHEIVKQTQIILDPANFDDKLLKETAEATTATANDLLHLDVQQGLATLIAGSESTSHDRKPGKEFGHRQMITHHLAEKSITANMNPRIQIRTPSPVVKKGLSGDKAYIDDVKIKLNTITQEYDLAMRLDTNGKKPRAFIFNSYTAIHDRIGDINGNLQTISAEHMLKGAHAYNAEQLLSDEATPVFCFLQNISVNGFGKTLGYQGKSELIIESTLMAELSLIHTLYDTLPKTEQSLADEIFKQYKNYLTFERDKQPFFSQSQYAVNAQIMIGNLKRNWRNPESQKKSEYDDVETNAKRCLQKLITHNLHYTHQYARLIQALSVFSEEASLGGCKSGNERAQSVNGRVALLDKELNTVGQKTPLKNVLHMLANADRTNTLIHCKQLNEWVDNAYNKSGLQGGTSLVSLVDQGAAAKVEAKPVGPHVSRNLAEARIDVMTNLQQANTAPMQAHKDLTKMMRDAWAGYPKTWWARMRSSFFGIAGAVIGILFIIPAVVVAIYNLFRNSEDKKETMQTNLDLSCEHGSTLSSHAMMGQMMPPSTSVHAVEHSAQETQATEQNNRPYVPVVDENEQEVIHRPGH